MILDLGQGSRERREAAKRRPQMGFGPTAQASSWRQNPNTSRQPRYRFSVYFKVGLFSCHLLISSLYVRTETRFGYYPSAQRVLYAGDAFGRVFAYVLPDGCGNLHFVKEDKQKECMDCGKPFSVLGEPSHPISLDSGPNLNSLCSYLIERKVNCRACGGLFCSSCTEPSPISVPDRSSKYCKICTGKLSARLLSTSQRSDSSLLSKKWCK